MQTFVWELSAEERTTRLGVEQHESEARLGTSRTLETGLSNRMFPYLRRFFRVGSISISAACFLGMAAAQQQNQRYGSVSGSVVEDETHAAIQGAQITLGNFALSRGEAARPLTADTEANGSFIVHVPPGKYLVAAEKPGYLSSSRNITVSSNRDVSVSFALFRPSSIAGRVVDGNGGGVPEIRVDAWAIGYRYGRSKFMHAGTAITDQTGNYRIDELKPAVYFLGATPHLLKPHAGVPNSAEMKTPISVYWASFYPNGHSLSDASGVPLERGQQLTDIDIRIRKGNGYCVTASLPNWLSPATDTDVAMLEIPNDQLTVGTGVVKSAKNFHFCGVPSGDYTIEAAISLNEQTSWFGSQAVSVDTRSVSAGTMPLEQARDLRGQIVVAKDQMIEQRPASVGFELEPVGRFPLSGEGIFPSFQDDGRFVFHTLYSEQYWLNVVSVSPGYYISRISQGTRDVTREPVKVGNGDVTVTVRSDGPSLAGAVTPENGSALPPYTWVILTNDANDLFIRSTRVDQNGNYSFDNLPPGKFKLIALSGLSAADVEDPSVIGNFGSHVKDIELAPYSSREVDLQVIAIR